MKTNHRRKQPADKGGYDYGVEMTRRLMRNGCGPNYTRRIGAIKAIAGKKKKDRRAARHRANDSVKAGQEIELGTSNKRVET